MTLDDLHDKHLEAARNLLRTDSDCRLTFVIYKDEVFDHGFIVTPMGMDEHMGKTAYLEVMRAMIFKLNALRYGFMTRVWLVQRTAPSRSAAAKMIRAALPPSGRLSDDPDSFEALYVSTNESGDDRAGFIPIQRDAAGKLTGFGDPVDLGRETFGNFQNYFDEKRNNPN